MPAPHCPSCSLSSTAAMKIISMAAPPLNPSVIASIPTHKPSRLVPRKNQLRPKILRTLKKPNPPPPPLPITSTTPLIVHELTVTEELAAENDFSEETASTVETHHHQDGEIQATSFSFGELFNKPVLKYGAYLLVAFLFQTICAAWVLGSVNSSSTSEANEDVDEKRKMDILINGNGKDYRTRIVSKTSNAMNLDEAEVESRIEEIRSLARQVRRAESRGFKNEVGSDHEVVSESRDDVEKEIASRLNKLQNRLKSAKKAPVLPKSASVKGVNGSGQMDGDLIFNKKSKFRSMSKEKSSLSPRGFSGSEARDGDTDTAIVDVKVENGWSKVEQTEGKTTSGAGPGRLVSPKAGEIEVTESKTGVFHKPSQVSSSGSQNSRGFGSEKRDGGRKSGGAMSRTTNRSIESKEVRKTSVMKKPQSKQQKEAGTDLWWLSLPCVFAILMRRGSDSEDPEGLFTVRKGSDENVESVSSFVVGFEDRIDANNFCFLLESFFEELGDFSADIVPLLRKELVEAVKAESMKVIVVRKGQLRLYAGQPFSEVESALTSLV